MDRNVTVKFFQVRSENSAPPFEEALRRIFEETDTPGLREVDLSGVLVRLERLNRDGSFVDGEIVRCQTDNIPSQAVESGLTPLPLSDGAHLGHSTAFRYHPSLRILAIQFDNRAVSIPRMMRYIRAKDEAARYKAYPLVRHDAWDRYNRGQPRKFEMRIASPTHLEEVEGEVGAVAESSKKLAEVFEAPVIKVEVSMGRKNGSLMKQAVSGVLRYFTEGAGGIQDIRSLRVTSQEADSTNNESINFLDEHLNITETLELPNDDPDRNYEIRRVFLKEKFGEYFDYICETYGEERSA